MSPSRRLEAPGMGRSCWRHVQLPRGGLAGWGHDLPAQKEGCHVKTIFYSLTGIVLQPVALLLLLCLATCRVVAACRPVVHPPAVSGTPAVHPGGKVGRSHAWREGDRPSLCQIGSVSEDTGCGGIIVGSHFEGQIKVLGTKYTHVNLFLGLFFQTFRL